VKDVLRVLLADDAPFLSLLRGGLRELSQAEYDWEPVDGCWSVRSVDGVHRLEIEYPEPDPSPFTTIAWRLVHLTGSIGVATATVIGRRRDDGAIDDGWERGERQTPTTVSEAVALLEDTIDQLQTAVAGATDESLERLERQWWDAADHAAPVWEHVLAFGYFEPSSHGAEIRLLRDLYRHTNGGARPLRFGQSGPNP
jgi:hypothetical protein